MICPNCGEKGNGRFCSSCGTRLMTEEDYEYDMFRKVEKGLAAESEEADRFRSAKPVRDEGLDIDGFGSLKKAPEERMVPRDEDWDEEDDPDDDYDDYDEGVKRKKRAPGRLTQAVSRGVSRVWDLICTGLRLVTAVLMLATAFYMAWGFLGNIRGAGGGSSDGRMVYLGCGAGMVLWAILQTFWILKKSRVKRNHEVSYIDRGHGIFAFLLFLLLYLASTPVLAFLPGHGPVAQGIGDALTVITDLGEAFLAMQFMGLILSALRRICGSGMR